MAYPTLFLTRPTRIRVSVLRCLRSRPTHHQKQLQGAGSLIWSIKCRSSAVADGGVGDLIISSALFRSNCRCPKYFRPVATINNTAGGRVGVPAPAMPSQFPRRPGARPRVVTAKLLWPSELNNMRLQMARRPGKTWRSVSPPMARTTFLRCCASGSSDPSGPRRSMLTVSI